MSDNEKKDWFTLFMDDRNEQRFGDDPNSEFVKRMKIHGYIYDEKTCKWFCQVGDEFFETDPPKQNVELKDFQKPQRELDKLLGRDTNEPRKKMVRCQKCLEMTDPDDSCCGYNYARWED